VVFSLHAELIVFDQKEYAILPMRGEFHFRWKMVIFQLAQI